MPHPLVLLSPEPTPNSWLADLAAAAECAAGTIELGAALAEKVAPSMPLPGSGSTGLRWAALATVASVDLATARVLESHADALAILDEAGAGLPGGTWGVFAAEAPGVELRAAQDADGNWTITGTKPWCSLASTLDSALVTATIANDTAPPRRALFAVGLHSSTVSVETEPAWVARGLSSVPSGPVTFSGTSADPVGPTGWYLTRDGFAWGGLGVAACWYGGAVAILQRLRRHLAERNDDLTARAVGAVDVALHGARCSLEEAARAIDSGRVVGAEGDVLALRVRSVVASAVDTTLLEAAHVLGPAPLAFEEEHARRAADLAMYVRQHHADRDLARLGRDERAA